MSRNWAKLFLIALIISLVSASAACASEYIVSISPDYQNIKMNGVAEYNLTIRNNLDTKENFEIYSPDVMWDVNIIPGSDKLLTVDAKSVKTTTLQLKPLYVNPGLYGVALNVRMSGKNMLIRNFIMVGVNDINPPPGEYLPAVRSLVSMPEIADPRENITVTLELENQNRRDIKDMDIRLRSQVINSDYKSSLGPLEKKKITLSIPVNPFTPPQEDVLKVLIFTTVADKIYQHEAMPFSFQIMNYGGIVEDITETRSLLKTTRVIKLTNNGNGAVIDVYKQKKGFIEKLFTTSEPGFKNVKEDGVKYLGWPVTIEPFETVTIITVTSYRLPFGIVLAAIIIWILYYLLRSPVLIHKSATVLSTKEGGISEIKVLIVVKNRSSKPVHGLHVIDKVTHIADVLNDFEMGTLHPVKVLKHAKKGTLVKWEMKELDKFEERVLAYKMKSRLSVLGEFKLPVAVARFNSASGKERSTHSNSVSLISA